MKEKKREKQVHSKTTIKKYTSGLVAIETDIMKYVLFFHL